MGNLTIQITIPNETEAHAQTFLNDLVAHLVGKQATIQVQYSSNVQLSGGPT